MEGGGGRGRGGEVSFFSTAFLHDLSLQLVYSSFKHFCIRALTSEAAASLALKAGMFFDLAVYKLLTFTEYATLDSWEKKKNNLSWQKAGPRSLSSPCWEFTSADREHTYRGTSRRPFVPAFHYCQHIWTYAVPVQTHLKWLLMQRAVHVNNSCWTLTVYITCLFLDCSTLSRSLHHRRISDAFSNLSFSVCPHLAGVACLPFFCIWKSTLALNLRRNRWCSSWEGGL